MAEIKRPNYFTYQFLVEKDFDDEQAYHVQMRRRLNRLLHTPGIAEGLDVTRTGAKQINISAGAAIDSEGREIVLLDALPYTLTTAGNNIDVFLTVGYQEIFDPADHYTQGGVDAYTRVTERPRVLDSTTVPPADGSVIVLSRIRLNATGAIESSSSINTGVRTPVSSKVAPKTVGTAQLADGAVTLDKLAPNAQPLVSIEGVSAPGGNVDLLGTNAISITPNNSTKQITITENHSVRVDNPHATTAAQVGALALTGGTVTGNVVVNASLGLGTTTPTAKLHLLGNAPLLRLQDGNQEAGRLLVSDGLGNGTWRDGSRYHVSGQLNNATGLAGATPSKLADFMTFNKVLAESTIEIQMHTRAFSGNFSNSLGVSFQIRVGDTISPTSNTAAITTTATTASISVFAVFQGLAVGTHTVSVWIDSSGGTTSGVGLDPGNWGGRIIVKETF